MKRRTPEFDRWLTAEAAGDEMRAEAAFVAFFARFPRLAPAADFAERVLAAAPVAARRTAPALWGWRWAIASALAMTGVAAWLLPALRWLPLEIPRLSEIVKTAAMVTGALVEWFEVGVAVWGFLLRFGRWVTVAVQAPEIAAGLAGSAVIGAVALYTLNHLLALERRSWR
jgi:hypothetical protein